MPGRLLLKRFTAPQLQHSSLHYGEARSPARVHTRLVLAGLLLILVSVFGTTGYYLIGGGKWSLLNCAYMVLITITTVGYGEVLPGSDRPSGRLFTMSLLIMGVGVSLYFLSALTALIIEGDLRKALWRRKMFTRLQNLSGHYIVCGGGRTGSEVVDELLRGGCRNVVVIEQDRELLERLSAKHGESFIGLLGDATEDGALRDAGVERAAGIATTLQKDQDNLFVALSARQLNAKLRIVSRGVADRATPKLLLAGADSVVNPTNIGGRRMAHELLHRNVVGFLDLMTRYSERNLSIEDVAIPEDSPLCGRQIRQSKIREVSNALVLAVVGAGGRSHVFNPGPDYVLDAGMTITVLGEREEVLRLKKHVDPQHIDSTPPPSRWGVLARRERL